MFLPDAEHSSEERRKERHADAVLTFAGAFAAGPGAWALLVQKWLILMRSAPKLQLVVEKEQRQQLATFRNCS